MVRCVLHRPIDRISEPHRHRWTAVTVAGTEGLETKLCAGKILVSEPIGQFDNTGIREADLPMTRIGLGLKQGQCALGRPRARNIQVYQCITSYGLS